MYILGHQKYGFSLHHRTKITSTAQSNVVPAPQCVHNIMSDKAGHVSFEAYHTLGQISK